jgi:hypothetical protein
MICPNCRAGADLKASLPAERPGADEVERNRWTGAMRRVTKLHGKCTNPATCPCQHRGTKHYRRAGSR